MDFEIEEKDGNLEVRLRYMEKKAKAICFFINTPKSNDKKIATIGDLETDDVELGIEILKKCEEVIKEKGFNYIVAPMNGNTWKKYRTLTYTNGEPQFILENVNSMEYNEILKKAGFEKIYTYSSTKGKINDYVQSKFFEKLEEKLYEFNITIRKFDKNNYLEDLKKIYSVVISSFSRNPLYTPINQEDFISQYIPYIKMFDEDLILIAEIEDKAIGFLFAIPNFDRKTIVVKTGAVLPKYEKIALGNTILSQLQKNAIEKGYEDWIFAFMYKKNTSQKSAKRHKTKLIREYALYGKEI